jgi:Fe-S-cluster containining protein
VAPYEVLRLARNLGLTTTEVLARHTEAGGIRLRVREDGACTFLTPQGCGVHADRPLVCRLYPLGRQVQEDGSETFGDLPPHPQTAGVYGRAGTVDDYLRAQDVASYLAAGDRYGVLYRRMEAALERRAQAAGGVDPIEVTLGDLLTPWLDVDATVGAYCAERGRPVPTDLDETVTLHIEAVETWLARF